MKLIFHSEVAPKSNREGILSTLAHVALACFLALSILNPSFSLAQSDRATLTGVVTDHTGAVVPKANVTATNLENGEHTTVVATSSGDYTLPNLPAGKYALEVNAPGFRSYVQKGITLSVAVTTRQDVKLAIGAASEVISVTSDASLLKTENAEQSTTITREDLNKLPIPFTQSSAIRDPMAFAKLTPGSYLAPGSTTNLRVNGLPSASFKISVDGMDSTNPNIDDREDQDHPGVDNVQEFTIQSSNFAAEFGQVGGGLFNFSSRSGTNKYHGAAYDYFTNEDLDAGRPFSQLVTGGPIGSYRVKKRQNDYGFTFGGPIRIPRLYNGTDKTFFFFSLETFRLDVASATSESVPTDRMRSGDYGEILTGTVLGVDPLGRNIYQNAIYDPTTARTVNGQLVSDPFGYTSPTTAPTNIIPAGRLDPVAAKIQDFIPHGQSCVANGGSCVNNYVQLVPNPTRQEIPAFKVDQVLTQKWKVDFSYSQMSQSSSSSADGLPYPITAIRTNYGTSDTYRLNTDYVVTPSLLIHVGAGYVRRFQNDGAPPGVSGFNAATGIGLPNTLGLGFPRLNGLGSNTYGGVTNVTSGFGPTARQQYWTDTANGIASAVWTHGTHVIKGGADYKMAMWLVNNQVNVAGAFGFAVNETALVNNTSNAFLGAGNTGYSYASFQLGLVDSGNIGNSITNQYHRPTYALYLQDTWHARQNLTVDYGVRWDFTETEREHAYRTSGFSPTVLNPNALLGGAPLAGALTFEGFGHPGDCECYFMPHYPYAVGPRLGVAYSADPKTVFRGGFAITYGQAAAFNYAGSNFNVVSVGINNITFSKPSGGTLPVYFAPTTTLAAGAQYSAAAITDASRNPGYNCCTSINQGASPEFDHNGGKPPLIYNYTLAVERELNRNLYLEMAYVGNRAHWLTSGANGAAGLIQPNALSAQRVASFGFDVTNPVDAASLATQVGKLPGSVLARLPSGFPYKGFPTNQTLAQALRPFPQYGTLYTEYSPAGKSWYDSLQVKLTQRNWHGLQYLEAFTWSKELDLGEDTGRGNGAIINDVFDRNNNKFLSTTYQPVTSVTSFTYDLPYYAFGHDSMAARTLLKGWTVGGIFRFASGQLLRGPADSGVGNAVNSTLLRGTFAERIDGAPLFTKNPNCHCFNPLTLNQNKTAGILNPAAWTEPALGTFAKTKAYMNDYRWQRQPDEEMNLGKVFHVPFRKDTPATLSIRAEYFNIFNHTYLPQPATGAYNTRTTTSNSTISSGAFGNINVLNALGSYAYRSGQIVARFEF